ITTTATARTTISDRTTRRRWAPGVGGGTGSGSGTRPGGSAGPSGATVSISDGSGAASSWVEPSVMSAPSSMAGSSVAAVAAARLELLAVRRDDLLGDMGRHVVVVVEGRAERPAAVGQRAELGRVAEELGLGHVRGHDLDPAVAVHAEDPAASPVEVAVDLAHVGLGHPDLHGHDRLEERRLRLVDAVLERHRGRDLERELVRVDRMERAVVQRRPEVRQGIALD